MKEERISVPTEDIFFLDKESARNLAVEALLISQVRELKFLEVYLALISEHLDGWIERNESKLDGQLAVSILRKQRKSENARAYLKQIENDRFLVLGSEVMSVGMVVIEMLSGQTKEGAMARAGKMLGGLRDGLTYEQQQRLPRSTRHTSKRTIERYWAKLSQVLHYAGIYTYNAGQQIAGEPTISTTDAVIFFQRMEQVVGGSSQGRSISLPTPIFLDFLQEDEFEMIMKEFPPDG